MVYLKSVETVIALGKLIGLLFLFCLPLLSILLLKTKRNDLARPVMGTIFLVHFDCIRWSSFSVYLQMRNLNQTELKRLKERLRISRKNKKTGNNMKQLLATLKILEQG